VQQRAEGVAHAEAAQHDGLRPERLQAALKLEVHLV
jgi:hypothetical protein